MKREKSNRELKKKGMRRNALAICFALIFVLGFTLTANAATVYGKDDATETEQNQTPSEEKMESETSGSTESDYMSIEDKEDDSDTILLSSESDEDETLNTLSESEKIGYVNADGLNVREGAGTKYDKIGSLSYTYVIIEGSKKDSDGDKWYKIAYGDGSGYVYGYYITNIKTISYSSSSFSGFPESYQKYLALIKYIYPNATFESNYIDYTLDEVVNAHVGCKVTYSSSAGGYVNVSYNTIYKYMNPLYYLGTLNIFPFVKQTYNSTQNAQGLKNLFSRNPDTFLNTSANIKALIKAGKNNGINPYVLASTILVEKGWMAQNDNPDVYGRKVWTAKVTTDGVAVRSGAGTSYSKLTTVNAGSIYVIGSAKDSKDRKWYKVLYNKQYIGYIYKKYISDVTYKCKVYNLFSVNQTDDNPVGGGIYYALKSGWTSLAKSLVGGAEFYKDGYISNGQDTYYYKDFNVINDPTFWWHEYAGGITDVEVSSENLACAYKDDTSAKLTLRIPVYKGMIEASKSLSTPTLKKVYVVSNGIKITWKAVSGASKYRVFRKTANGSWERLGVTTKTYFTDTTAKNNKTYTYTVRCISSDGKTYLSSYDKTGLSIKKVATPEVKTLKSVSKGVKIKWNAVTGAKKYRIFRRTKNTSWTKIADTTNLSYIDTTAKSGKTYYYTIRCINAKATAYTSYYTDGKKIKYVKP